MRISRRTFVSSLAATSLLSQQLKAESGKKNKSVIWLWLGGGASSTEMTNPIPDASDEYRGVNGSVFTKTGYLLGGDFPRLAELSAKFTTVRSFTHPDNNHGSATGLLLNASMITSGENLPQIEPSHGSIVSKQFGTNNSFGVPTYTKLDRIQYDNAAWLGSGYGGFDNDGIATLSLKTEKDRLNRRIEITKIIEELHNSGVSNDWANTRNIAGDILNGTCANIFKLENEDKKYLDLYNCETSDFGKSVLLARRLVEHGSRFVNISIGGWDLHWDIAAQTKILGQQLDHYLATLIQDLDERGLLAETLVVVATEFGRTPKLNNGHPGLGNGIRGRDHYSNVVPLILIGSNYATGEVIGEADKLNAEVISKRFYPEDLRYTVLNHFGISKDLVIADNENRPHHIVNENAKLIA